MGFEGSVEQRYGPMDKNWIGVSFAKMMSDAKGLRISDIHIDVRAREGKACNIVTRSFGGQRGFSVGTGLLGSYGLRFVCRRGIASCSSLCCVRCSGSEFNPGHQPRL
jgi:hypothetical protein